MPQAFATLAEDFPTPELSAWRARGEKGLEGGLDSLLRRTEGGLAIQPLYTHKDGERLEVRPVSADDPERPWDLRCPLIATDRAAANAEALEHLAGGAASLLVPTQGLDIRQADDLAEALDGVLLDVAPVALEAGTEGAAMANHLAVLAKGAPEAPLAFHLDPLSAAAEAGQFDAAGRLMAEAAQTALRHAAAYPKASLFLASGRFVHEAGGHEVDEIATALASAVAAVRALNAGGMAADQALGRIVLGLSADQDLVVTIAKLRAARACWARITAACQGQAPARLEVRASGRMLSAMDTPTNLIRLTLAAFGAGVGGADAVILRPFDGALGQPGELARRQLRNIQLVLMEEAGLGRVADPAGGAFALETLSVEMARAAWQAFQQIEAGGGLAAGLPGLADRVAQSRAVAQAQLQAGERVMIGVNVHAPDAPVPALPPAGPKTPFSPVRWAEPVERRLAGDPA